MTRPANMFSTLHSDKGKRTYIITTSGITPGDELNRRNGDGGKARERRDISAGYQPSAVSASFV